ncbi:MAG: transglutaminase-like cysteine peptidase [Magnetococcales bacterium]|nr:transglutaminase-like cysteine peptidase [Magnetococcales bacterium]NGZ28262.1 transglutaminase-like cysteine peptidase [Magnetococcales bacterium]
MCTAVHRFWLFIGVLLGGLTFSSGWADSAAIHAILKKQLPLLEDPSGRGARLNQVIQEHMQQKPNQWADQLKKLEGLTGVALLEEVHDLINARIRYEDDPFNEWLPPHAAYTHGGDCEDYASAKLLMLRESGFPEDNMRIITLAPIRLTSPYHVVLVAEWEGQVYVSDTPGRAQSKDIVKLEQYKDGDRPVVWGGWSGGFAFSNTTLNKQPATYASTGLLIPRRSRYAKLVSGENRLILVAADLRVITRREPPLTEAEKNHLRLLRAYFHEPSQENARRITASEAKKLDGFRKLRN